MPARGTGNAGEYYVVFSYMEEDAGVYAARASVKIAQALTDGIEYNLDADIQGAMNAGMDTVFVNHIREETALKPTHIIYHLKELEAIL